MQVIAALSVIAGLVLAWWALGTDPIEPGHECERRTAEFLGGPEVETPAVLEPEKEELAISFGRSRAAKSRKFFFGVAEKSAAALPPRGTLLDVRKRPLNREGVDGVIDVTDYEARMEVTTRNQVTATVCVDPLAKGIHPGTYRGEVLSDDRRIEDVSVSVVVSLQYQRWRWVAFYGGLLAIIAGSIFVWSSSRTSDETGAILVTAGQAPQDWADWVRRNILGIAVGVIAAGSTFTATYLHDPGWGDQAPTDWFTLTAAMFAAFTTGLTGGRAALQMPSATAASGEVAGEGEPEVEETPLPSDTAPEATQEAGMSAEVTELEPVDVEFEEEDEE